MKFEDPSPTKYAIAVYEELLRRGYDCRLEEKIEICGSEYSLDIWIPDVLLDIEINGRQHDAEPQLTKDRERRAMMDLVGITTKCFSNHDVFVDVKHVVDEIVELIQKLSRDSVGAALDMDDLF